MSMEVGSPLIVSTIWNLNRAGLEQCWLKCSLTGVDCIPGFPNLLIVLMCSYILLCIGLFVSPTYCRLHLRQVIVYITLGVRHEILQYTLHLKVLPNTLEVHFLFLSRFLQYTHVIFGHVVFLSGTTSSVSKGD